MTCGQFLESGVLSRKLQKIAGILRKAHVFEAGRAPAPDLSDAAGDTAPEAAAKRLVCGVLPRSFSRSGVTLPGMPLLRLASLLTFTENTSVTVLPDDTGGIHKKVLKFIKKNCNFKHTC